VSALPHRVLGSSGLSVSIVSLGSWMTYEHMTKDDGVAVMHAAREQGIDFLDDARYDDRTGTAPIPTGYSEVLFGELFRAAGWRRDDVVVANKLWLEFWPHESVAAEVDGSLRRMGFDHVDLLYAAPPPADLEVGQLVDEVADLVTAGKVRAWGVLNWTPRQLLEAGRAAQASGAPRPCAAQLPYNVVDREAVDDAAIAAALDETGVSVVASAVLAGGLLTGKYRDGSARGRLTGRLDAPHLARARRAVDALVALGDRVGASPAALALAFALDHPRIASVLVGATSPQQIAQNVEAVAVLERLAPAERAELRAVAG